MDEIMEFKTLTITEKGQICIPQSIRCISGFKEGSKIGMLVFKDRVELRPLKNIGKRLFSEMASEKSLALNWNSKEDKKAWKNL